MRYYKIESPDGKLLSVGIADNGGEEITEKEYHALLAEIREFASYVDKVYSGAETADKVPEKWREDVQEQVEARKAADAAAALERTEEAKTHENNRHQ